jgi:hypothetical protein
MNKKNKEIHMNFDDIDVNEVDEMESIFGEESAFVDNAELEDSMTDLEDLDFDDGSLGSDDSEMESSDEDDDENSEEEDSEEDEDLEDFEDDEYLD